MIGAAHIKGIDLPDAVSTPTGAPDVSDERRLAANAHLLWCAVRETIRHDDSKSIGAEPRGGAAGLLWRGNPLEVAEIMWHGLDRSQLADETVALLYSCLHESGHLSRVDTGNKGRQWWVADKWDHPCPPARQPVAPSGRPGREHPAASRAGEPDWAAVLQGLLDDYRDTKEKLRRTLAMASMAGASPEDLREELLQLRGVNEELRASNKRLRQENADYKAIVDQPYDDE